MKTLLLLPLFIFVFFASMQAHTKKGSATETKSESSAIVKPLVPAGFYMISFIKLGPWRSGEESSFTPTLLELSRRIMERHLVKENLKQKMKSLKTTERQKVGETDNAYKERLHKLTEKERQHVKAYDERIERLSDTFETQTRGRDIYHKYKEYKADFEAVLAQLEKENPGAKFRVHIDECGIFYDRDLLKYYKGYPITARKDHTMLLKTRFHSIMEERKRTK